jgi:uncharacterized protein (DUF1697 family)
VYVALLRGINVGGYKKIKMETLRQSFAGMGFAEVRTYVQSGNVIFTSLKQSPASLAAKIEARILRDFGFDVSVLVRTAEELGAAIRENPFLKEKGIDPTKLHVTFLSEVPAKSACQRLSELACARDQFRNLGREIYLHCPDGYGVSKLSNNAFEKLLAVRATTRNWNSTNKIYEMMR